MRSFVGTPYIFKGNGPGQGFDCSGLIVEGLKSVGLLKWNADLSSQGLYEEFVSKAGTRVNVYQRGALAFYGKDFTRIEHVAMFVDQYRVIEAAGGDSTTDTIAKAVLRNAFVRERIHNYRSDYLGSLRPDYSRIGSM